MSVVQYTQDTKLSLMNSSLIFTNKNVVTVILELEEFSNLHSWKNEIYNRDERKIEAIGYRYGTTLTLNVDIDKHMFSIGGGKQQIVILCDSEELRDELNNKIYSFLYFNNFIRNKQIFVKRNKPDTPISILLRSILEVTDCPNINNVRIVFNEYSKTIEFDNSEVAGLFKDTLQNITKLFEKTRETLSEEDMLLISREVETLKEFPFIIY